MSNIPLAIIKYTSAEKCFKLFNNSSQPINPQSEHSIEQLINELNTTDFQVKELKERTAGMNSCLACCCLLLFIILFPVILVLFCLCFPILICFSFCCNAQTKEQKQVTEKYKKIIKNHKNQISPYYDIQHHYNKYVPWGHQEVWLFSPKNNQSDIINISQEQQYQQYQEQPQYEMQHYQVQQDNILDYNEKDPLFKNNQQKNKI